MADEGEGFLRRWARRKTETAQGIAPVPEPTPASTPVPVPVADAVHLPAAVEAMPPAAVEADPLRQPTMDDVAQLTSDSDFSAFVARGVDGAVRRSALKKLFADPHFKVLDRLDMYMDDYTKPSPMPDGMLASLKHSKSFFDSIVKDVEALADAAPDTPPDTITTTTPPPEQETP